jgi:replicative superfamily II helicase
MALNMKPRKAVTTVEMLKWQSHASPIISDLKRSGDSDVASVPTAYSSRPLTPNKTFTNARYELAQTTAQRNTRSRLEASAIDIVDEPVSKQILLDRSRNPTSAVHVALEDPFFSLKHPCYALPDVLVENLASLGVGTIYPWQSRCLLGHGLLNGEKNLVYTAPTGGGKSLVADILMLKRVLENKKAILVLPYVALVQEKLIWLRRAVERVQKRIELASQSDSDRPLKFRRLDDHRFIRVAGFFGGNKARDSWADIDIAVCTIEKANSLVNAAIEEGTVKELGIVVMDELHMIDDEHRGYLMELMATKLLSLQLNLQVVGMSATLSNTEVLAKWLNAKYYETRYKPVPTEEYLVHDNTIYPIAMPLAPSEKGMCSANKEQNVPTSACRVIRSSPHIELRKPIINAVVALAVETVKAKHGALVFCGSRLSCQSTASLIATAMPTEDTLETGVLYQRIDLLSNLRSLPVGLDDVLEQTIPYGVAFHHAGLTTEERALITQAFDKGVIRVVVATCSLAAGINLPARRVILQGARMGRDFVGPAMLRQMRGRAGRKGKDELGESYVCCVREDLEEVEQLLEAEMPPIQSCLTPEKRGIKRALLEVIAVRLAAHPQALQEYIRRTLLYHTTDRSTLDALMQSALGELVRSELIMLDEHGTYNATALGQAVVASALTPDDGLFVHAEFQKAMKAFVLDGEMHIFYMFTPIQPVGLGDINWPIFRREIEDLDDSDLRVLHFCGVNPAFVNRMLVSSLVFIRTCLLTGRRANSAGQLPETSQKERDTARVYRRFYAALQLRDLCNEMPIHMIARKYDVPRGFIQNLAQTCEGFAAGTIKFCERMGWGMLRSILEHMSDRLKAGAKTDLLELAQMPYVKSRTARVLWENGLKSVRSVAAAEPKELVDILLLAQPKRSKINGEEERGYRLKMQGKAEIIVAAANRLWERQQRVDIEEYM